MNAFLTVIAAASTAASLGLPTATVAEMADGFTSQPIGHYDFCNRKPHECMPMDDAGPMPLDRDAWDAVVRVNREVNAEIESRSDLEAYGVNEWWTYPDGGYGDCEDYALEKRRRLVEEHGFSYSSLLMTVVLNRKGEGHAILIFRTAAGDYVLDNAVDRVVPWNRTGYTFLKRQYEGHAGRWKDFEEEAPLAAGTAPAAVTASD